MKSILKLKSIPQLYSPLILNQTIKFAPKSVLKCQQISLTKNIVELTKNLIKFDSKSQFKQGLTALALFLYFYRNLKNSESYSNECCGIVGYIGNQKKAGEVCMNGLHILESRGYDSCGIVSINNQTGKFQLHKFASSDRYGGDCIKRLEFESNGKHDNFIGIGHTRWATHGDKTDVNAHPHFDHLERIALVHNGIISNYFQLKQELHEKYNIVPKSQTDTEIVAIQIGIFLDQGQNVMEAIKSAVKILEGAYSFVMISILDPEAMYIVKNTGTMVIGFSENLTNKKEIEQNLSDNISLEQLSNIGSDDEDFKEKPINHKFQIVSSDTTVFQDYTKKYYNIDDKEILRLSLHDKVEQHKIKTIIEEGIKVSLPPGINHYYVKEMLEQPDAVARTLNYGARLMGGENMVKLGGLDLHLQGLQNIDNLIIAACGTSHQAGQYGQFLMRELGCFKTVQSFVASEINQRDFPKNNGGFLSISQSGETMDLLIPFRLAQQAGLQRINIVNKVNSTLARENECGMFLNCGREFSVASTKAFICQVVAINLVAIWFAQNRNFNATKKIRQKMIIELKMLSGNMQKTLDTINDKSQEIALAIKDSRHVFFCGHGLGECIAAEGALKMKELTYIHCQNIKLYDIGNNFLCYFEKNQKVPVIFIILDKQQDKHKYIDNIENFTKKVNILPIIVTDIKDQNQRKILENICEDRIMYVQKSGWALSALLCVIPLQRLAYDLTIALGQNPDKPRNLAKELTTQ